jgi:hypothetical protein
MVRHIKRCAEEVERLRRGDVESNIGLVSSQKCRRVSPQFGERNVGSEGRLSPTSSKKWHNEERET